MIDLVTSALADYIGDRCLDLGTSVSVHSMSNSDDAPQANNLTVTLIAIDEHDHLRNAPPVQTTDGYRRAPLRLRLSYMVSYTGGHDEAQVNLGRVLAIFHTTPILRAGALPTIITDHVETLTVQLRNTSHDERNHIWTALGRPARLAVYYTVDVALIDLLDDKAQWGRVEKHRVDYVGMV